MSEVQERFIKAVADHELIVVSDHGLSRHLTFKKPDSSTYHFHIVTWPGYLSISGDAGCYVFSRLADMFEFFRGDGINAGYWGEKLQAVDRHGGYREFSAERFHEAVKSDFDGWTFDGDDEEAEASARANAWAAIQDSELGEDNSPENINDAISTATDYACPISGNNFTDFWDHNLEDYTFRFLWCCYAIQWAIAKYDAARLPAEPASARRPG